MELVKYSVEYFARLLIVVVDCLPKTTVELESKNYKSDWVTWKSFFFFFKDPDGNMDTFPESIEPLNDSNTCVLSKSFGLTVKY